MDTKWFEFIGGFYNSPVNYILLNEIPSCPGNDVLYAILAEVETENGRVLPVITQELMDSINDAVSSQRESDHVKLKGN